MGVMRLLVDLCEEPAWRIVVRDVLRKQRQELVEHKNLLVVPEQSVLLLTDLDGRAAVLMMS